MEHLAWHETLEMHELAAAQSVVLIRLKKSVGKIYDPELRELYLYAIRSIQQNLEELLPFYNLAPMFNEPSAMEREDDTIFYAADLLVAAKQSVRSYAIAITETATPRLRKVLEKQIKGAIKLHEKAFQFMYSRGYYPSYNLNQLLHNDVALIQKAISHGY